MRKSNLIAKRNAIEDAHLSDGRRRFESGTGYRARTRTRFASIGGGTRGPLWARASERKPVEVTEPGKLPPHLRSGVMGNTADFDSAYRGSNPWSAITGTARE